MDSKNNITDETMELIYALVDERRQIEREMTALAKQIEVLRIRRRELRNVALAARFGVQSTFIHKLINGL